MGISVEGLMQLVHTFAAAARLTPVQMATVAQTNGGAITAAAKSY